MCRRRVIQRYCALCDVPYGQAKDIKPRICMQAVEIGGPPGNCDLGLQPVVAIERAKRGTCSACRGNADIHKDPKSSNRKGGPGGPSSGGGNGKSGWRGVFGRRSSSRDQGQGGGHSKEKPGPGEGKRGPGGSRWRGGGVNEKQNFAGDDVPRRKGDGDSKGRRSLWKWLKIKVRR